jgi:hypothetical protein
MMVAVCDAENAEVERQKISPLHAITGSHWLRAIGSGGLTGTPGTAVVMKSPRLIFSREVVLHEKQVSFFMK